MQRVAPTSINWPDDLSESRFLAEYWQQKPLLIRQAFTDFETPITPEELAGLSLEPETTPRLITRDQRGTYHLEYGPFEESRFNSLTSDNWSLLVTDVEKHLPQMQTYLLPFRFLPSWRIDDLMISYAPVGASVGAHKDEYDVFLLQASGRRKWFIDRNAPNDCNTATHGDLKLIESFRASDEWELMAGDILYLPPGLAHHGVASEEPCMTWSIGFRAPAIRDMVMRISEMIAESMPLYRYRDGPLNSAVAGEITPAAIERFQAEWIKATSIKKPEFAKLLGALLTEAGIPDPSGQTPESLPASSGEQWMIKAPFSRMAWYQDSAVSPAKVSLFVDGDAYSCSKALAMQLCVERPLNIRSPDWNDVADQELIEQLVRRGCLLEN